MMRFPGVIACTATADERQGLCLRLASWVERQPPAGGRNPVGWPRAGDGRSAVSARRSARWRRARSWPARRCTPACPMPACRRCRGSSMASARPGPNMAGCAPNRARCITTAGKRSISITIRRCWPIWRRARRRSGWSASSSMTAGSRAGAATGRAGRLDGRCRDLSGRPGAADRAGRRPRHGIRPVGRTRNGQSGQRSVSRPPRLGAGRGRRRRNWISATSWCSISAAPRCATICSA